MAFRTWAKLLGATLGVAALAGASQLGVAYGLGILRLARVLDAATRDQWTAQLAWVAWLAMMAAVLGGLAGGWLRDRWRVPAGTTRFIGLSVAAGVGAMVVVPLTMQPARTAQVAGVDPVFVIGLCAGLGALGGTIAAYAALTRLVARWSLSVIGLIIWVIALVALLPLLAPTDPLPAVRLGVLDAGFLAPVIAQRTALFTMPAVALITGAALGWVARRREMPTLTIALAGLAGPALLTAAYLIAGPGSGSDRYQVVPYWAAMTATGAGVLGSVLVAVVRRGEPEEATTPTPAPAGSSPSAGGTTPSATSPSAGRSASTGTFPSAGRPAPTGPSTSPGTSASAGRSGSGDPPPSPRASATAGPSRSTSDVKAAQFPAAEPRAARTPDQRLSGESARPAGLFTAPVVARATARPEPSRNTQVAPGQTGIALGEHTRSEPEPFDAFRTRAPRPAPEPARPERRPSAPASPDQPPARGSGLRDRMPFGRKRSRTAGAVPEGPPPAETTRPGGNPLGNTPDGLGNPQPAGRASRSRGAAATSQGHTTRGGNAAPASDGRSADGGSVPRPEGRTTGGVTQRSVSEPEGGAPRGFRPSVPEPKRRGAPGGRGPLVPEPQAISTPLPQPDPITPPLAVTPAPQAPAPRTRAAQGPGSQGSGSQGSGSQGPGSQGPPPDGNRRGRKHRKDGRADNP